MNMKGDIIKKDAIDEYNKFMHSRRPLNKSEHPNIYNQEFTALIKFLLKEAISLSYSSKLKAKQHLDWLNTEEGISWDEVMQKPIRKEVFHI